MEAKTTYEEVKIEVVSFDTEDVIVTSYEIEV